MTNDLTFTGEIPVLINYNGSSSDIFSPVRSSSCDINIVSADLLTDLYTARKDEVLVKVEKGDELIWEGYQTPNVYTQELTQNLDQISMTAIDPVSLMKYCRIDKVLTKPAVVTYEYLIGRCLAYVKLTAGTLYVERTVSYGTYDGSNGLLSFKCQVSNFWDEGGEPSTMYEMIEELLRPFGLCLAFSGKAYYIYDVTRVSGSGSRTFDVYTVNDAGTLTKGTAVTMNNGVWKFSDEDWRSNNTHNTSLAINETYDKVTGVASSCIPSYSTMAFDLVKSDDRDKYDAGWLNVQRNKIKGYVIKNTIYTADTADYWYYIWNGVYTNEDYNLVSNQGWVNGWLNINPAYKYLSGETGHPNDYGSILNFYGGRENATATGKEQGTEKSVEVKRCITGYAPDNGIPPEFLEKEDLKWTFSSPASPTEEDAPVLAKVNSTDSKFGTSRGGLTPRITYHQEYPNMTLLEGSEQKVDISLTQTYSRTGLNTVIPVMEGSYADNRKYYMEPDNSSSGGSTYNAILTSADVYYMPWDWQAGNITVDTPWFNKYSTVGKCLPVWDSRRMDLYITLEEDGVSYVMQFTGKDWVKFQGTEPSSSYSFNLKRLMNYEKIFHNDFKYQLIECSDGVSYGLFGKDDKDKTIIVKLDRYGGVLPESATSYKSTLTYTSYWKEDNDWYRWIDDCNEGKLSIILPEINAINVTVVCDVYSSTLLGKTGSASISSTSTHAHTIAYEYSGTGKVYDTEGGDPYWVTLSEDNVGELYGHIRGKALDDMNFIPVNATYVKSEHLDLSIEVSVPESNLGQMFSESDVKYTLDKSDNYLETYEGPTFKVNTYHPLVASSFSYLIYGYETADPGNFLFHGNLYARPECYVVQAYMNCLHNIRKVYKKTLVPVEKEGNDFGTILTFITSPEVGSNTMAVVSDSIDIKTNRHSVEAVEDHDINVDDIETFSTIEIPRKARNYLFNLPTARK